MSESENSKLVQFKEVAVHFDVSVQTVRNWVREKKIPFIKLGNVYRFRINDIEKTLRSEAESLNEEEDSNFDEMTESQIQSSINRVKNLGLLWYRRPEHRKQIREIIDQRPFNQKVISHLFTGIPLRLADVEIAQLLQMDIVELRKILARQSIMLHPRYFTEELHDALMEEIEKIEKDEE